MDCAGADYYFLDGRGIQRSRVKKVEILGETETV